ncbi:MAG TPA: CDP-alcohol phosphatidyltransferase family protein [Anaerolineae bacterium]|nr:CDP-alcohol phosphatidyltransferase family protein [Anaerolineae bacterium]
MLTDWARSWTKKLRMAIARALGFLGFSPNGLTILGYLVHLPVMYVLATGRLQLGGVLVALAGLIDTLDGALARETGQDSQFGAFLDSVSDRYSEGTVLFGLFLWYLSTGARLELALIFIALLGSVMVSYARARAEALGFECRVGLLTRLERVSLVVVGLVVQRVQLMLWAMAIFTNVTAIERIYHVWRHSRRA